MAVVSQIFHLAGTIGQPGFQHLKEKMSEGQRGKEGRGFLLEFSCDLKKCTTINSLCLKAEV